MLDVSESKTYKRQGRRGNLAGWWTHMREFKRQAHKKCRQITRAILRRDDGE